MQKQQPLIPEFVLSCEADQIGNVSFYRYRTLVNLALSLQQLIHAKDLHFHLLNLLVFWSWLAQQGRHIQKDRAASQWTVYVLGYVK